MAEHLIVIGAGPAGIFAALSWIEHAPDTQVTIVEKESEALGCFLKKNRDPWSLTREIYEPAEMADQYVRGGREMLGPLHRWGAADAMSWFEQHGIAFDVDETGRVIPVDGIDVLRNKLLGLVSEAGIKISTNCNVVAADAKSTGGFWITLEGEGTMECDSLVLAGGGLLATKAKGICAAFGHTVVEPVPAIFDLHTRDSRIVHAAGELVEGAHLIDDSGAEASGLIRLEPWGLSGPVVGELTSRAAESMRDRRYTFSLRIDWIGGLKNPTERTIDAITRANPRRPVGDEQHAPIPSRLWLQMVKDAGIDPSTQWQRLTKQEARALHRQLRHDSIKIVKRGSHYQETAVCGGVALSEIDFRSFQSRLVPGLHFVGDILDVDGLPGGANLQTCWTTGWLAGLSNI
ncbi:aminoacetone oxidase family FAD-binding enzyme [Rubellicoccus peritrichatus]|uniref:Aminoacetone oxidase family FAD-binding enzyme n=1 Tax=Rubellicoccus peritrichatus TaxID=3080537 RepID=A0AAQ3LB52_9BACT|nr:aminoacetone oxidase family FAD-binding enzyme [Puniceicoccus sp. CR14]WOO41289.1 aminoacetone oxidase family FAD-binding enzyme [Puniceicoccus sp. CR14]